jgi:septal ring-binding cell division protein DamX/type II secretory pathway predicted ATPase ExeA
VDEVLSRLGLTIDPFDDVVIDDMFFTGAGRGALIDELIHQVRYGEGVCLVSGATGIGKTRLWHHLPQLAPADTFCVSTQARLFLNAEQFFALCLGSDEDAAQEEDFLQHLQQLAQEQRQHWLLIDDAHELHDSLYKKLAQWCAQYRSVLRVVLFADDSLKYRLQNPAFNFSLSYWELQPLNDLEVAEYLMYRLQYCGWSSSELPFSPEDLDQISRHSEGVPLHIHDLAIAVLQKSEDAVTPSWQRLMRWPYLHVGLLLLAGSCLAVVWMGGDGGVTPGAVDQPQVAEVSHPLSQPSAPDPASAGGAASAAAPAPASGGPATIEFRSTMQQTPPPAAQAATVATPPVAANAPPPIPENGMPQSRGAAGPQVHAVDSAPINTGENRAPVAAAAPAAAITAPAATPAPATVARPPAPAAVATAPNLQQKVAQPAAPKPAPVARPAPVKAPAVAAAKPAPVVTKPASVAAASPGLASLSSQHYVVQLIAAADPARIASFRKELPADLKLASYQRITSGQRWHVLVYGDFPSIAQARAAINQLPSIAREQKPWAKPVSQIHKEMATVKQ